MSTALSRTLPATDTLRPPRPCAAQLILPPQDSQLRFPGDAHTWTPSAVSPRGPGPHRPQRLHTLLFAAWHHLLLAAQTRTSGGAEGHSLPGPGLSPGRRGPLKAHSTAVPSLHPPTAPAPSLQDPPQTATQGAWPQTTPPLGAPGAHRCPASLLPPGFCPETSLRARLPNPRVCVLLPLDLSHITSWGTAPCSHGIDPYAAAAPSCDLSCSFLCSPRRPLSPQECKLSEQSMWSCSRRGPPCAPGRSGCH